MNNSLQAERSRNAKGLMSGLVCALILLIIITAACLAVDISHNVHIHTKLQAATDAGALAGVPEITKDRPSDRDQQRAFEYAALVTGANEIDDRFVKNEDPNTTVSIFVDVESDPKTVRVCAARKVNFLFGNLLRYGYSNGGSTISVNQNLHILPAAIASDGTSSGTWVGTNSTAAPFGITSVYPHQVTGIIASIDHVPKKGPAKGQKIANILDSNKTFDLVWNPQNAKNVGWIKAWITDNNTIATIGDQWQLQNGVVSNSLNNIKQGDTFAMPITNGGMPMNNSRAILGFITVDVLAKYSKGMTVKIHEPNIFHGVRGIPNISTSAENQQFLQKWQPWTVQLID